MLNTLVKFDSSFIFSGIEFLFIIFDLPFWTLASNIHYTFSGGTRRPLTCNTLRHEFYFSPNLTFLSLPNTLDSHRISTIPLWKHFSMQHKTWENCSWTSLFDLSGELHIYNIIQNLTIIQLFIQGQDGSVVGDELYIRISPDTFWVRFMAVVNCTMVTRKS